MEISPDPKKVGNRIREIRKNLGLSMNDLAKRIDDKARSGTVSNWETGKNLPNNNRLKRIAEIGGISNDYLLYGSPAEFLYSNYEKFVPADKSYIGSIALGIHVQSMLNEIVEKNISLGDFETIEEIVVSRIPEIESIFLKTFNKYLETALTNTEFSDDTLNYLKKINDPESFFTTFANSKSLLEFFKHLKETDIKEKANNHRYLEGYVDALQFIVEKGFLTDFFAPVLSWDDFLGFVEGSFDIEKTSNIESIVYRLSVNLPAFEKGLIVPSNEENNKLLFIPLYDNNTSIKNYINKKCLVLISGESVIGILNSTTEIIEENSCNKIDISGYNFISPILVEFY